MTKSINVILITIFSCFCSTIKSQPAVDTIKYSFHKRPVLFGDLGTRNSFIDNYRAQILGIVAGLNFNDRVRLGVGYNQLYSSSNKFDKMVYVNSKNGTNTINSDLRIFYGSVFGEYVYYKNNKWEFSIPLQFGFGEAFYKYVYNNETKQTNSSFVFVYEPAVSVEYKLMRWIGVGANVGFRFLATNYKHFNQKLNSPTYAFNLIVYYGEIYRHFVKKKSK